MNVIQPSNTRASFPRHLWLVALLLWPVAHAAASIHQVPDDFPTLESAIAAAQPGDTVRITDSATYPGGLVIDKPIFLEADIGQTPVIEATGGESFVIRTGSGAEGGRVGHVGRGRITLDAAGVGGVTEIIAASHGSGSGSVGFENLELVNPATSTAAIRPTGGGESYFREIWIDAGDVATTPIPLDGLSGGKLTLDIVEVANAPDLGILANGAGATGEVVIINSIFSVDQRAIFFTDSAGPIDLTVESSYFNNSDTAQAWNLVQVNSGNHQISLQQSAFRNVASGSALYFFPSNGSTIDIRECDLLADSIALRLFSGAGNRTLTVQDCNVIATNAFFGEPEASDTVMMDHNNVVGSYGSFSAGANDRTVNPQFLNEGVGNFRYSSAQLKTASSIGNKIGTHLNFSGQVWSSAADNAYASDFEAHFGLQNPVYPIERYLDIRDYDRFNGTTLDARLAQINEPGVNQGLTPTAGGDIWSMSLNEMYRITGDIKYFRENLKLVRVVIANRDDRRDPPEQLWDGEIAPVWSTDLYSRRDARETYVLHEGQITYPIFDFLRIASEDPALMDEFEPGEYNDILQAATEAIDYHSYKFVEGPLAGEGYYEHPSDYDDPPYRNLPTPFNWQHAAGRALWTSWLLTGNTDHRDKAIKLANFFKNRLGLTPDGAYIWVYYAPVDPVTRSLSWEDINSEDTGHAALTMTFPVMMAEHGQVFDRIDMLRFGRTMTEGLGRLGEGVIMGEVNGNPNRFNPSIVSTSGQYALLASFVPEVHGVFADHYRYYRQSEDTISNALLHRLDPRRLDGKGEYVVPDYFKTLESAYYASLDNTTIRLTDSGTYPAGLNFRRKLNMVANPGQTPTLTPNGESYILFFDDESVGSRVGSATGGRIIIDNNNDASLTHTFRFSYSGDPVTIENVEITGFGPQSPASQYVFFPGSVDSGDAVFRRVTVDAGGRLNYPFRLDTLKGTLELDQVVVRNVARSALFSGGNGSGIVQVSSSELSGGRDAIQLLDGQFDFDIQQSWLRSEGNAGAVAAIQSQTGSNFTIRGSVLYSPSPDAVALQLIHQESGFGANISIDQSDLVAPGAGAALILDTSDTTDGITFDIRNTNLVSGAGVGMQGALSTTSGDSYAGDFNNLESVLTGATPGTNTLADTTYVIPPYFNPGAGDFRYSQPTLETSDEEGGPIGSFANFGQALQNEAGAPWVLYR